MKVARADYAVIGHSLAGISAALTLAKAGGHVALLDFHRDTDRLAELPRIEPTSLGASVSGAAFERAMQKLLVQANVERRTDCFIQSIYADEDVIVDCHDERWSCRGVVFAPNGTEPGIDIEDSSTLQGFGISYSAAADAPFFLSRRVAVYGDAPRAIEHACVAAQYASDIVVLLKSDLIGSAELVSSLNQSQAVTFERRVVLRSLLADDDGLLTAIRFDAARGGRTTDVSALFVAQHLVPAMEVVRGEARDERIAFAGLASGINYWEHPKLVSDGARAARMLLTVHR